MTPTKNDLRMYWCLSELQGTLNRLRDAMIDAKHLEAQIGRVSDLFSQGAGTESDREWLRELQGKADAISEMNFNRVKRELEAFSMASIDVPGDLAETLAIELAKAVTK